MSKPDGSPKDRPRVIGLILNWNGGDDTLALLKNLQKVPYPDFDMLVLDNDSSDDSVEKIHAAFPEIEIIQTGANRGYAGGNNVGFRLALERAYDYALVLNNDLTVAPEMVNLLIEAFEKHQDIALAGPKIYRSDKPKELFYPAWRIDLDKWLFYRTQSAPHPSGLTDVDFVQGCAVMVRREFLEQCGMFDERFHLYCEDADLAVRARAEGWRTVEVEAASAWHRGYGSSGRHSPLKTYYSLRNRLLFIKKHGRRRWSLRWRLLVFDAGPTLLAACRDMLTGRFTDGRKATAALCQALWHWAIGRFGKGPQWLFKDLH
jgi:GT2 family glycosyltransferase